jgi:hypothetical protein
VPQRLAIAFGLVAIYLLGVSFYWPQINDDAFITFRYSLMLAEGHGPYFNPGERVEGYTNFLLMLLSALAIRLDGPDAVQFWAQLINVLGGLAAVLATAALTARWIAQTPALAARADLLGAAAGVLVATNAALLVNSTTGLETAMFAGWLAIALLALQRQYDRRRYGWSGVWLALAAWTRPEGAGLAAAVFFGRVLRGEWRVGRERGWLAADATIAMAAVAAQLGFRLAAYDGEWVPNTYLAKLGGLSHVTPWQYIESYAWRHLGGLLALVPLLAALPGAGRRDLWPAAGVLAFSVATIFANGADWMLGSRLLAPYAPAWAGLAVVGLVRLASRMAGRERFTAGALVGFLTVGLVAWQVPTALYYRDYAAARTKGYRNAHARVADWLREHGRAGEAVALMDIGLIGFRNPGLRVLDVTGLTDRHIAKSPGLFLGKEFDVGYVFDRRPEYLVFTFGAPRRADGQIDLEQVQPWTGIERRMVEHPAFVESYLTDRPASPDAVPLERLAAAFKAAAMFEHDYPSPETRYFLAIYVRRAGPAPGGS